MGSGKLEDAGMVLEIVGITSSRVAVGALKGYLHGANPAEGVNLSVVFRTLPFYYFPYNLALNHSTNRKCSSDEAKQRRIIEPSRSNTHSLEART